MFRPQLELERVERFLGSRFGELRDLAPIGAGEWSSAFSFTTAHGERVARFGRYRTDYEKDRIAAEFARPGLPVPAVLEIGEALGCVYAVSERAHGIGFDALDRAGYARVLPAVFDLVDALRTVTVPGGSGFGLWGADRIAPDASWREFLLHVERDEPGSRAHPWRPRLRAHPGAAERFDAGLALLQESLEVCPEARHVIHADLMGDNLLVSGKRVVAVVDWGNALYGDWVYDLARLTFWTPWFPELELLDLGARVAERFGSEPDFEARLRCYHLHLGLEAQAYNAFTDRIDELESSGRRTLELAGR